MKIPTINKVPLHFVAVARVVMWVLTISEILGCNKIVEVDAPITSTNAANVYASDATAAAVLTGIYTTMSANNISNAGLTGMSYLPGLSSDEFGLYPGSTNQRNIFYYTNSLTSSNTETDFWKTIYPVIFVANSAIDGLQSSTSLTPSVKLQLLGEAHFIRAFCYFYLVNLYGDVPLVINTDAKANSLLQRSPKVSVWLQVENDLKEAQKNLSSNYLQGDAYTPYSNGAEERVRPTKWLADALLARTYLYEGKWAEAEQRATTVIENSTLFHLTTLESTFLKNSPEAIWQLQPVFSVLNTWEAYIFILPPAGPNTTNYPIFLNKNLIESFENLDQRKTMWVGNVKQMPSGDTFYYAYKYKIPLNSPVTEYPTVVRLAEMYLIRSEARAQQNNYSGALSDLNTIRTRAGLSSLNTTDKNTLLNYILHERQVEYFSEWGHRWFDLKRTNSIDSVMSKIASQKGAIWNSNWQLYPIPQTELLYAPNLKQNPGY